MLQEFTVISTFPICYLTLKPQHAPLVVHLQQSLVHECRYCNLLSIEIVLLSLYASSKATYYMQSLPMC